MYGFEFGEVAENQGKYMFSSMKTHCLRVSGAQDGTTSLDI